MLDSLWQWILVPIHYRFILGAFFAFALGVILGRLTIYHQTRRMRLDKAGDEAFFKGIQYILSNEPDQAIEQLTKFVQINSETIETYVALGNLYRSKGDIDRAIRIRQSIILRPNISEEIKFRALIDLGLDYRKGGFLNWALETFKRALEKQPGHLEILKEVERIYEETRDWENAFKARRKISKLEGKDYSYILAHQRTEAGKLHMEKKEYGRARTCFKRAISIHPGCIDAFIHQAELHIQQQDYHQAVKTWKKILEVDSKYTFLVYRRLESAYGKLKDWAPIHDFLEESTKLNKRDAFSHLAWAQFLNDKEEYTQAIQEVTTALAINPTFWEARKLLGEILLMRGMKDEALEAYRNLISYLHMPYLKFQCNHCGYRPLDLEWQCPQCRKWDTIIFSDQTQIEYGAFSKTMQAVPPVSFEEKS